MMDLLLKLIVMIEKKYYSTLTIHPGEYLSDELEAREISQKAFAIIIQKSPTELNELIKGKRSLTPDRAVRISSALGTSLDMRLSLQETYTIATTKKLAL